MHDHHDDVAVVRVCVCVCDSVCVCVCVCGTRHVLHTIRTSHVLNLNAYKGSSLIPRYVQQE